MVAPLTSSQARKAARNGGAATITKRSHAKRAMTSWEPGDQLPERKLCTCPVPLVEVEVDRDELMIELGCARCGAVRAVLMRPDLVALRGLRPRSTSPPPPESEPPPMTETLADQAVALRKAGRTYRQIADALGLSSDRQAHKLVKRATGTLIERTHCPRGHPYDDPPKLEARAAGT